MRLTLLVCLLAIAVPLPARAVESYAATIDGSEINPASSCVGHGTFTLSADETQLAYEIHFENWITDEFASHIHELNLPPLTGEHIVDDIAEGQDKIGSIPLEGGDVVALRASRMFVMVHSVRHLQGEVKGWIVPTVDAKPTSWGAIRSLYR